MGFGIRLFLKRKEVSPVLGHLIRKEILDHLLSLRFLILSGIGALIISLSLYDGHAYYRSCLRDYQQAQVATQDRIRQITDADDWFEVSSVGYLIHKPPTPMNIFIRGLEPTLGRSIPIVVRRPSARPQCSTSSND